MGTLRNGRSTISCLPIIETINSDISEYIATNVISITDGQFYFNKNLFNLNVRPAIDSGLSVTRIGSNASCKFIKLVSAGIKNELTILRMNETNSPILTSFNNIFFQEYLFPSSITTTIFILLKHRNASLFNNMFLVHRLLLILSIDCFYLYYILFISKTNYSIYLYYFIFYFLFMFL